MAPKIVDKEMKRLEIAAAAGMLFGKYGFDKVKVDDVAAAAGIGKGTVYEYFKNKDELIHGAFQVLMNHMAEALQHSVDLSLTPLAALKKLSLSMADAMDHFGEQYGFFLEYMLLMNRGQTDSEILQGMFTEYRRLVAGLIEAAIDARQVRADVNPAHVAAVYLAWFDGAIFHWMLLPNPNLQQMVLAFWDAFEQGIIQREES
ncbi:MAG: TetR/AcrR family transcriptional regulator [Deltaproteobacteria bacterium]|nr:TetR/AcrR family transcriptional regulator [Deltaproteobacteria bacterium]MBN2672833.1 TetR/AcrR family transcriptional regulator [Deltaproteobacteria bacterium]